MRGSKRENGPRMEPAACCVASSEGSEEEKRGEGVSEDINGLVLSKVSKTHLERSSLTKPNNLEFKCSAFRDRAALT